MNKVARRALVSLLLGGVASVSAASAGCDQGELLFHCSFSQGKKAVTLCQEGERYSYAYGRIGYAPELRLVRDLPELGFTPWNGIGRSIWEEVTFRNASVEYLIGYSIDRVSEAGPEGSLTVMEGGQRLALLICDAGSVEVNFTPLANAVFDAGLN